MNFDNTTKAKILFGLNLLSGIEVNGYKFKSYDVSTDDLVFTNGKDNYNLKGKELNPTTNNTQELSETSPMQTEQEQNNKDLSETSAFKGESDMNTLSTTSQNEESDNNKTKQVGGSVNKSIFKSSKYSETSSVKPNELSNYSKTSSMVYNGRSDNYSDTSVIGQVGGDFETSDTLRSVSELKERKSKSGSKSNLDMGIFKKSQSGGSKSNVDLKKRMLEVGINSNSSSTSSICE